MGWMGRRLAIVAALTLVFGHLVGSLDPTAIGGAAPTSTTSLVKVHRLGTVDGAERTLSDAEFRGSSQQGLSPVGNELVPAPGSVGTLTTAPVSSPIPFSHLGLRWRGNLSDISGIRIEVRASRDGASWTDWYRVLVNDDLPFQVSGEWSSTLVEFDARAGLYSYAQARLTLLDSGQSVRPSIASLRFAFINPYVGPQALEYTGSSGTVRLAAFEPLSISKPSVVSRTDWGCPDGEGSPNWTPEYRTVTAIIIHHTATTNTATDWAAQVRVIWYYHAITNGWGDIGYNYLIDPNGRIYEGRAGGDDVVGGHALQYNWGSMGVAFLGDFSSSAPSAAAQSSMINLLSWKAYQRGIDPMVMSQYFVDKYLPTIMGHRDAMSTTCPGDGVWNLLGYFRTAVRDRIASQSSPPSSKVDPLPAYENHQPFDVTWSGTDNAVAFYIQYRDGPSGAWVDWPGQSPAYSTAAQFSAGNGHTYYFRSLAVDAYGNKEYKPDSQYDTYTTIDTTPPSFTMSVPSSSTKNWFVVRWSGSDTISGVGPYFNIDVSNDGANWSPWIRNATGSAALYVNAKPGWSYYFRLTGWDLAANSASAVGGPIVAGSDSSGLSQVRLPLVVKNGPVP